VDNPFSFFILFRYNKKVKSFKPQDFLPLREGREKKDFLLNGEKRPQIPRQLKQKKWKLPLPIFLITK